MEYDTKALASEALSSWETNAVYWDEGVGADGNKYWKSLQEPSLRRLLGDHLEGARALDLATANGLTARWLINNGCISVLATDGTEAMLEQAKKRASTNDEKFRIEYEQLDVTSPTAFEKLLEDPHTAGAFDIVLINMAIMDIANIEPLAEALPRLLKPDGVPPPGLLHLARNSPDRIIRDYLHIPPYRGVALYGQPAPQVYFHRPMHELFGIFFRAGLVMDQFEEPAFTEENEVKERIESHANFTQLPAILSFRLRKLA
ncbi:hypothetical protein TruAng_006396 [Truncatella angustata]|nr:hypothetical protein TruAng_006396 [Truncatella angustata]